MAHKFELLERKPLADPARPGSDEFKDFGCTFRHDNPDTPDRMEPEIQMVRKFFGSGELIMPDGEKINFWGFEDPETDQRKPFPSATIRVPEGKIVHNTAKMGKNTHTIHHHGIEPTPHNDGVGHTSFELTGDYTYQWRPRQSGTYFYHCHKNTPLHFQRGMKGFLIVDPPNPDGNAADPQPPYLTAPGFVRRRNEIVRYDREAFWVSNEIDARWHEMQHDAGLCGEDVGLNRFEPRHFLMTGVPSPNPDPDAASREPIRDARVAINAGQGETILIRCLNAGYTVTNLFFDEALKPFLEVIGADGRMFGYRLSPYSRPFQIQAEQSIAQASAERVDFLIHPKALVERDGDLAPAGAELPAGVYRVILWYRHWITGRVLGVAETLITIG